MDKKRWGRGGSAHGQTVWGSAWLNRFEKVYLQLNSFEGQLYVALTCFLRRCFPSFTFRQMSFAFPVFFFFCMEHFTEEWEICISPISSCYSKLKWGPKNLSLKSSSLGRNFRICLETCVPSLAVCNEDLCADAFHPRINLKSGLYP